MCELLECIITAWPNHPGRPELVSHITHTNGFELNIRLHKPEYLGGLKEHEMEYDIYLGDYERKEPLFYKTVDSFTDNFTVELTSEVRINGVDFLSSLYYLTVQLIIRNGEIRGLASIPHGSPSLVIHTFCDLIG